MYEKEELCEECGQPLSVWYERQYDDSFIAKNYFCEYCLMEMDENINEDSLEAM